MHIITATTKTKLAAVTAERDQLKEEKERELGELNRKLEYVQKSYETIIQVHTIHCTIISNLLMWYNTHTHNTNYRMSQ